MQKEKGSSRTKSLEATERSFVKRPPSKLLAGLNKSGRASSILPQFDNEIVGIAQEIERYLVARPQAADSVEGIARWWLSRQRIEESYDHVQQALDFLIAQGRIRKTMNTDGTYIYSIKA